MKLSITTKILGFSFAVTIISTLSTLGTSVYLQEKPLMQEINAHILGMQRVLNDEQKQNEQTFLAMAELIANQGDLALAVAEKNIPKVQELGKEWMKKSDSDFITISDEKGIVLGRGHSTKVGDAVLNQQTVVNALAGKGSVGLVSGTVEPFTVRAGFPVKRDGKVVGSINLGISLTNPRFVDKIKSVFDMEVTIFKGDERVMTTILNEGKRAVGTKLADPVILDKVQKQGQTYQGNTTILGTRFNTIYWPIYGMDGKIAGTYFLGKPISALLAGQQQAIWISLAIAGAITILLLMLSSAFALTFTSPIKRATAFAEAVAAGNLSSSLVVSSRDEIGMLAEALRSMVSQLKERLGFAQGIMSGLEAPLLVTDQKGKASYMNRQFLEYTGVDKKAEELLGRSSGEIFYKDSSRMTLLDQSIREQHPIVDSPISWFNHKQVKKHMLLSAVPLWDLDHNLIGSFMLITDMTDVRNQQESVLALNDHISVSTQRAQEISTQQAQTFDHLARQIRGTTEAATTQQSASAITTEGIINMRQTLDDLAQRASQTTEHTRRSRDEAAAGAEVVQQTLDGINRVAECSQRMEQAMHTLGEKAISITHVVELIKDVADQTNLLALNAAIEAARAGESGRGFAVVADEVRKLAEKTMSATEDVNRSISELQNQVDASVALTRQTVEITAASTELARQSGESLQQIVEIAGNAVREVDAIATATREQSIKSAEMVNSMEQISTMAQDTTRNMHESTDLVQNLSGLADNLKGIIDSMGSERRQADRCALDYPYTINVTVPDGTTWPCRLINISPRGLNMELPRELKILSPKTPVVFNSKGEPFESILKGQRAAVQWCDNMLCGVELETILPIEISVLRAMAADKRNTR